MKLRKGVFTGLLVLVLMMGFVTTSFATIVGDLTKALNATGISDTSLVVQYIQSVKISQSDANKVKANIDSVKAKIGSAVTVSQLSATTKTEISNLIVNSAKLLQLNVKFIDNNGNQINLASYTGGVLKVQIYNLKGSLLTTANLNTSDLTKLVALADSLKTFADVAVSPILPKTGTNYGNYILLGLTLIILGMFSYKPIRNLAK